MIFLTGDTHGYLGRFSSIRFPIGKTLTKRDFVIILGDFGLLWETGDDSFSKYWIKWLEAKPWTTLFLDGNHENFDLIDNIQTASKFGNDVGRVSPSIFHLRRGRTYTIDQKSFFVLGGAASIDKQYRVENKSWWAREQPNEVELNLAWANLVKENKKVDYVLTHTCPTQVKNNLLSIHGLRNDYFDPLEMHLQDISDVTEFKHWFFGHFHENITIKDFTCIYDNIINLGEFNYEPTKTLTQS